MVLPCLMSVFNRIGESCFGWIGQRIQTEAALLTSYPDNIEDLKKQVKNLSDAIESVQNRIEDAANNQGATLVDPVVKRLLEGMASVKEEASKVIADEERSSDSTCLMGLRPYLWACYQQTSKSAKETIDEATKLLEEEKQHDWPVASVDYSNYSGVTPIPEFVEFESRRLVSNKIVAALKDPRVNMVGVYGMGGAGKTTLAEKIGAFLLLDSTFNYVVTATVSEKKNQHTNNSQPDLFNIQKQIAEGFKIKLPYKTLKKRAAELDEHLQDEDKVLIILDDIWSGFELKDLGIPISNVAKKFKILMTSRSEAVLLKEMSSKSNFGLDSLPHPDALILFDRMVGGHVKYSNWRSTAEQVVIQCGGVPIILVTIAKALRNEASEGWEDALTQLKQFDGENILEAYKMIEVSYNFLNSEEKKLLLLCAQSNHRSIPMEALLRYAMGLNLFNECTELKEVHNRLHKCLSDLKGCCLLQDSNEEGMIKMHDVVHKFASFVALRDHHVFSVADGELQDWPCKNELEQFSAIFLPECHLPPDQMLPAAFDNPKLESFIMVRSEIDASFQIPDNFFAGMKGLKLMDLTRMSLSSAVVSSLGALAKLQTLCLHGCELSDITVIGELLMLQALSLVGSSIILVPKEIGNLGSTLKLLDLSDCRKLKMIASGVIFRLTLLEDLRIGDSCKQWKRLLEGNHQRSNIVNEMNEVEMASMEEFKNLQKLINLEIHIHDHAEMFPKDLVFTMLETFKITFGSRGWPWTDYVLIRYLTINESDTVVNFDSEGTRALMARVESLLIARVNSCVSEIDPKGFLELKHLDVQHGDKIQYIVTKNYRICIFRKLEALYITRLCKLERICDDHHHPLMIGSFENLRILKVSWCANLKDLFSSYLVKRLLSLIEIKVVSCDGIESIIVSREIENEDEIIIGFTHHLRVLILSCLPRLISFKQIKGLSSPTPLFNKKIMLPELEVLHLMDLKIEKIWDDHLSITAEGTCWLQNLTTVEVHWCNNLRYLFTSSMVKSLAQLKRLEVGYCDSIEEIVASTERETTGDVQLSFPKLECLKLPYVRKLKRFFHANLLECQSVQTLFDEKIVFPKLEELVFTWMGIEKIWDFDHLALAAEGTCRFQNLTSLLVVGCANLKYVFSSSMVKSLAQLQQFKVVRCESIEEIVASTERDTTAGDMQLSLPKVHSIKLKNLPNLKRFCQADLLEFQLLRELVIKDCSELKTFVSANDSSSSDNSTTLFTEKIAFPNLEKLKIQFVTSIIPTSLILTCQQLERLEVRNCDKIDLFSFNNIQLLNDAFAKVTSGLKYFYLESCGLKLQYEHEKFKLEIVMRGFEVPPIFFALLQSCPKLEEVVVSKFSIIQLFPCETDHLAADDIDTQANTLVCVRLLKLTQLSEMKHIWSEHSPLKYHVIPEFLEVVSCGSLISLAPPSATLFKNLTGLVVWDCDKLIKLLASSTAKSLVNLKEMSVLACDSLDEIVVIDDQLDELASTHECVVFDKLEVLKLQYLDSLMSFCSTSDCNFWFPSLNRVIVAKCPKMNFFCKGDLRTPKLTRVEVEVEEEEDEEEDEDEDEEEVEVEVEEVEIQARWEGDLNATIRQMFEESVNMC